jgi:hypothetical protein
MTSQFVATRSLIAIDRTGAEKEITVAVGMPYQGDDASWACPVALQGLYPRLSDIAGVDGWQALQLAIRLVETLLRGYVDDGGRLLWPENRDEYEV